MMSEARGSHDNGALEALGLAMKNTPRRPFFLFIMCGEGEGGGGGGRGRNLTLVGLGSYRTSPNSKCRQFPVPDRS